MAPLAVDPAVLDGAGAKVVSTGEALGSVISTLTTALGGCNGMAGDDPAGAAFGRSYDNSASKLLKAMATTRNGLCCLGYGVQMSAHNYSLAEAMSNVSGHGEPLPVPHLTAAVSAGSTPSAVGSGVGAPAGWGWVAPFIGMIWPNGDSAKLRAAAAAWISAGTNFEVSEITGAVGPMGSIGAQQIPEGPAIAAAFGDASRSVAGLLQQCTSIAAQLTAYAARTDEVHAKILDLLSRICDPMTGVKEVIEFLTDQDEDEIKKIANDIRTIINQFTTEVDALRQQVATAVTEAETILTTMGRYAEKEWDQFLHGTPVGRALNQAGQFGKGLAEEAGGLVKDGWTYGLVRAAVDPQGWYNSWSQMIGGMAPLVGLGGDHATGVGQAWKDLGKNLVHWDEWKTNPAEAAGKSTFDIASLFVPGGGEGAAAAKGARTAADAAEAAAKAAPREAAAVPRALEDVPKPSVPAPEPHAPHVEAPPHEKPAPPHDEPAPHSELPGGRPESAPQPKDAPAHPDPSPHSPVESKPPTTGAPLHDEGPRPPVEPTDPGHGPPPPGGGSPPPPGQGPPPPGPHPSMPDQGSPPPGPHPPAEPPQPAPPSPPGDVPPPTGEPPQPAPTSPSVEGPPPADARHQPAPSTPSGEGPPPADAPHQPAATTPLRESQLSMDPPPQPAATTPDHTPPGHEHAPMSDSPALAPVSAGGHPPEFAPKDASAPQATPSAPLGRADHAPGAGKPSERPLPHNAEPQGGRPTSPPPCLRPHADSPVSHPSETAPHGAKPSGLEDASKSHSTEPGRGGDHGGDGHGDHGDHDGGSHGNTGAHPDPPTPKVPGVDFPHTPKAALEILHHPGAETDRLSAGHVPPKVLDGYDPLAGRTPERFERDFTIEGPNGEPRWDWEHQAPHNGFAGIPEETDHIPQGARLDRIGPNGGAFLSPEGTPLAERATPPGLAAQYHSFEGTGVPIPPDEDWVVLHGPVKGAFGQPGGGEQWVVVNRESGEPISVNELKRKGMIIEPRK